MKASQWIAAALLLVAGAGVADEVTPSSGQPPAYLSGGIGEEEREALRQTARDYSLWLWFASRDGHNVANVQVRIEDRRAQPVMEVTGVGPWFFARLPPGSYKVTATADDGEKQVRTVRVGQRGVARTLIAFSG